MNTYRKTLTALAKTFAEAVFEDEDPREGGFDLSAGMYGPHVSEWLRNVAEKISGEKRS